MKNKADKDFDHECWKRQMNSTSDTARWAATKDLTWKDSPMTLKQVHDIARYTNSFGEFKAEIDKCYNGTPETVVDLSEYVLTKKQ